MQNRDLVTRVNNVRIYGLPLQFVVVVIMAIGMTIFFGAWAADARIEARSQPYASAAPGAAQFDFNTHPNGALAGSLDGTADADERGWERAFLFACPLH